MLFALQNVPQERFDLPGLTLSRVESSTRTSKFDLSLYLHEAAKGLWGFFEYATDMFDSSTVARLAEHYRVLLERIVADPAQSCAQLEAAIPPLGLDVTISSTFTGDALVDPLRFWFERVGLTARISSTGYNQVLQSLLSDRSMSRQANCFHVILLRLEDWGRRPAEAEAGADDSRENINFGDIERNVDDFVDQLRMVSGSGKGHYLIGVCPASLQSAATARNVLRLELIKTRLTNALRDLPGVVVLPLDDTVHALGVSEIHDAYLESIADIPYTQAFFVAAATSAMRALFEARRHPYKVIVADCDNTLWRGICGEDGPLGVEITPECRRLQDFLVRQAHNGVLVCLCSRNNEADVIEVFRSNKDMLLSWEDVVLHRIGWGTKSASIAELAAELDLALDSFLFLDDDAVECAAMAEHCPEVLTLRVPQGDGQMDGFLSRLWAFDGARTTDEDRKRSQRYRQERQRREVRQNSTSLRSFIAGLELKLELRTITDQDVDRVVQMMERTTQFNTTGLRLTAEEVRARVGSADKPMLIVEVSDRFGDYGKSGLLAIDRTERLWTVQGFALSCRVLGREVEYRILELLGEQARASGVSGIEFQFQPTARNVPAQRFLQELCRLAELGRQDTNSVTVSPQQIAAALQRRQAVDQGAALIAAADEPELPPPAFAGELDLRAARRRFFRSIALQYCSAAEIERDLGAAAPRKRVAAGTYVEPATPTEQALASIWREVLRLERVGVHDNFFELGGHSLLATRLMARIRDWFQAELPLRALFEAPTIDELAVRIEAAQRQGLGLSAPPLVAQPRSDALPLSYAQERLWLLEQIGGLGSAYNLPAAIRLRGELDVAALQRAFALVVERHEVLRTRFAVLDGSPVQVIDPAGSFELAVEHLSELPESKRAAVARERVRALVQQRFDLERGPLFRAHLLRLSDEEHIAVVVMHHIVSDGWSIGILIREVGALYGAFSQGKASPLSALAVQYADYGLWQRGWLQGDALEKQVAYWKQHLNGAPAALELPTDRPRPAVQSYRGANYHFALPGDLMAALNELAHCEGATLFMVVLAAFNVVLSRWSGQQDIVVGSPIAGRTHRELEGLIGFFVNTLVLRTDLRGDPIFKELLGQVKKTALAAYAHQDVPFEKLVEELNPVRDMSRQPLFQVLINSLQHEARAPDIAGLRLERLSGGTDTSIVDLELYIERRAEGRLSMRIRYATDLFERSTVERLAGHLRVLLEGIVVNPDARLSELPLLPARERRQLLEEWNATAAAYPRDKCLHELFAEQAARTPDAVALVYEDSELSYGELDRRSNQLAHYLRGLGVGPETVVGLCVERSLEMVVGLLGILKAGGAYLPLDPGYPAERLAYMVGDAKAPVLVTQARLAGDLPAHGAQVVEIDADWARIERCPAGMPRNFSLPDNLAYVIYTSGSTGKPKGVGNSHSGIVNRLVWMQDAYKLGALDKVLQKTPFSFDVSVWEFFWPLICGSQLVIARPGGHQDPAYLAELIARQGVTIAHFVPSMLDIFLRGAELERCGSLRDVMCSGEALSLETKNQFLASLPGRLHNLYGPTEAAVDVSAWLCTPDSAQVPIGRPIANMRLYVLDVDHEPVPIGVGGELYIGGVGLARGYLGRAGLTGERFVPSPFGDGERLYRTGDLARWRADGELEYLGRIDHQVKVRGYRIELGEIEARLVEHDSVGQAVVVARDEGADRQLVAYIVGDGVAPEPSLLRAHLKHSLPDYMMPSAFVLLDALPLTPNGKVDRRALPAPEDDAVVRGEYVAPRTPREEVLAGIWADVLKLDRVGVHDNFFELGGHSLLAIGLLERMRQQGLHASVRTLFTAPTVATLADAVSSESEVVEVPPNRILPGCDAITPEMLSLITLEQAEIDRVVASVSGGAANVQDIYPLAPLQEGILFHHLMASEGDVYLMRTLLAFDDRARLDNFVAALQAVIHRHDIFRTGVVWEGLSVPVQVVWRQATLPIEEVALDEDADAAAQLLARFNPRRYRVDVRKAPMLRVFVAHDVPGDRWLLLLLNHHLADDNTTLRMLIDEISAHVLGQADRLAPPVPFRNFVARARLGVSAEEHEAFFREMLGDVVEPTAPFGLIDVQGDGSNVEESRVALDPGLARRLRERARALGVNPASLFHLAWAQVLARASGHPDVVFGTVLFGRMQGEAGVDRALGLFINTLPVRIRVDRESVENSVRQTHQLLTRLLRHEHASLVLAQRCSAVARSVPLFNAVLNYRHIPRMEADERVALPAWKGVRLLGNEERSNYPLTLSVDDLGDGFRLKAQIQRPVDAERVCGFMCTALSNLADALESAPAMPIETLDVLTEAEHRRIVVEWNATSADYPHDRCLHELFGEQAARMPGALAVVYENVELSYGELERRSNQLAHHLRELGVGPDVIVGLCVERSPEMIVGLLGILKAGGAYLPLDPSYPTERLAYMMADSRVGLVLTAGKSAPALPAAEAVRLLDLDAEAEAIMRQPISPPRGIGVTPQNLVYVLYTSGSTGRPKGVMGTHSAVVNRLNWDATDPSGEEIYIQKTTPNFIDMLWEVFMPLIRGQHVVIAGETASRDLHYLIELLRTSRASRIVLVPSLMRAMLEAVKDLGRRLPDLRYWACSGEALTKELVGLFYDRLPDARLLNVYGTSEFWDASCSETNVAACDDGVPIGRLIPNMQAYVLDAAGAVAPIGISGELYIGGVGLSRGYLRRPGLTAERFVPSPFGAGERLYRTGDLARWRADGELEYLGRIDHQVKLRGLRIELGEIEARLLEHPDVGQAVVVAREDAAGDKRLAAYVVGHKGAAVDAGELRVHLKRSLPEHMVPAAFVLLDALPLTSNGKVDRRALPAPEGGGVVRGEYVAPRTAVEELLAAIWCEVLKLDRVGINDNFFELGGHSLLAMRLMARARDAFQAELPLRALFEAPELGELAARVEAAQREGLGLARPALARIERPAVLPLSYAQERLWLLAQIGNLGAAYNTAAAVRLKGELDVAALELSFSALVERHETLRTRFAFAAGSPTQSIHSSAQFKIDLSDASGLPRDERPKETRQLVRSIVREPFDLTAGALFRVHLLKIASDDHIVVVVMHQIISDGWSTGILTREIGELYAAAVQHRSAMLQALPVQYADYALWQRSWLQGEVLERQLSYWRQQLNGAPTALGLPTDRLRPAIQSYRGDALYVMLPADLTSELNDLARSEGATLFMVLLAAFNVVLSRWSGQSDIVVGTPIAGRTDRATEGLIGFFLNTLALRTDLNGDPSFRGLLGRVKETALGAYAHQDLPFEKLVAELQPVRDLSRQPIFQVLFALQNVPEERIDMPGLALERVVGETASSKFDLSIFFREMDQGLGIKFEYATDLFERATIERMAGHLRVLLEGVVADPDARVGELPLLPESERHRLIVQWNDTAAAYPRDKCLHELFSEQALKTPDAVAVVCEGSELTYGDLDRRSNQLAHHLRGLGVGPEVIVGLCVERSLEMVVGLLGILKAGGAYLPLDPSYPADRLAYMLSDAGTRIAITAGTAAAKLPSGLITHVVSLDHEADTISLCPSTAPRTGIQPDNLAYVIYTSGSTGRPKGAAIRHQALVNLADAQSAGFHLRPESRVLQFASLSFDASISEIAMALRTGATLCLAGGVLAGSHLSRVLIDLEIDTVTLPPSALLLLDQHLPSLQTIVVAGEACPTELAERWLSRCRFIDAYGPTETTVCASFGEFRGDETPISIGRPMSNMQMYVLDAAGEVVPVGVSGELYIGGVGLARGYLNRPALTAERFLPSPFGDGARLYRTGDLGRWRSNGKLEYLGRIDHQVKLRGYRIELGEIETALLEHEQVRQAVVIARDEGASKRLVAYVVSKDASPDPATLRGYLKQLLPDYMVPSAFVMLDALPLTPNGKVDRKSLPAPEGDAVVHAAYEAPRNLTEETLASIWCEVLKLERVGVHDNFFELGGHSLLAMRVIAQVRETFRVELALRAVFEKPTVGDLAARVEATQRSGMGLTLPALVRMERTAVLPLSYAQERLWLLDQIGISGAAYHMPAAVRLRGDLDAAALERSFAAVVERHEGLRTRFAVAEGKPFQVIDRAGTFVLRVEDLSELPEGERAAATRQRVGAFGVEPFDLARGPLFRVHLLRLSAAEHVAIVVMHHIVSDGWSIGVLIREVAALYAAFSQGRPSPLAELAIQYADYAAWQRGWLQGELLAQQVSYWRRHLKGAPAALELPTDRPRPAVQSYRGAYHGVALPVELTASLHELARSEGATLFMVLLGAFSLMLSRWSGQSDIVVGSPIAGRTHRELEGLIGFFVNTLALRPDLSGNPSFRELVGRVKESALGAYAHQDLPFEKLVAELQPVRDLSRQPIFQALFALQNVPRETLELPGLRLSMVGGEAATAKFDLALYMHEREGRLAGYFEYATDLFDATTIERLAGHLRVLLEGIVADPNVSLNELPLLPEGERQQLLEEWNATAAAYPRDKCLHELFAEQAARTPDAVALVYEDSELSYRELDRRSNQLAHYLCGHGVGPEVIVGLCIERSLEMVVGLLGILKAGGAYLPLDPDYPADRLAYMLADARAPVVVTQARLVNQLPDPRAEIVQIDADWTAIATQPATTPPIAALADNLAYVLYTSGSTGRPKGVSIKHASAIALLSWSDRTFSREDTARTIASTSICFDLSVFELFVPLCSGGQVALANSPIDLPAAAHNASLINTVPSAIATLLQLGKIPATIRVINLAGEPLQSRLVQQLYDACNVQRIYNLYGPSEDTTYSTHALIGRNDTHVSIGRPISNTRVYVLDTAGDVVPVGVSGELYIGGAGLARGYLNRSDLTAERFVPSPFGEGERLYRTGDIVRYLSDGNLEFLGRIDHQVKLRGYRIELGEIEARLAEHGSVGNAIVVAREDEAGQKRLVAYVVGKDEATADAGELRVHLQQSLPDYMIPSAFVTLKVFPLTPNGKIDRRALPMPEDDAVVRGEYVAPRTPREEVLAGIWADVLKLDRVGVHDNFFELGGHSLLAIGLLERMRQQGLHASVRTLFTAPTVATLADAVSSESEVVEVPPNRILPGCDAITPEMLSLITLEQAEIDRVVASVSGGAANVQDIYPLAPLQEGILFHHLMASEGDVYLMRTLLAFDDRARLDNFVAALQAVIHRHDIFRTGVVWEGLSVPVQVVWRQATLPIEEVALDEDADAAAQLLARFNPRRYRVDVRKAPMLRVFVAHDVPGDRWLLLLLNHHLADDNTTLRMLIDEISAHVLGQADRLAPPVPFRNFVARARLGVSAEEHEAFFREMLGDVVEPTAPFGLIDVQGDGSNVEESRVALDPGLARRLRERARALGVNPASLFHLAWAQVLARASGHPDVVFGTVLFGRMQGEAGVDRALGLFINTLPVRIRVDRESVENSVRQTHQLLTRLLRHEHASLVLAQRCSAVARSVPLFNAVLNYRHIPRMEADERVALPAWKGVRLLGNEERSNYPLTLSVDDLGDGFRLKAQIQRPVDAERVCGFMCTALSNLADALESAPAMPIETLDVLTEAEHRRIVVEWNATSADYPHDRCLHELFGEQAARMPGALAVVYENVELSYGELERRSNQLAHHLRELGVGPDVIVGLCVERSPEMIVGLLGILKAGGAYLPLDPSYPTERLAYMMADSRVRTGTDRRQERAGSAGGGGGPSA